VNKQWPLRANSVSGFEGSDSTSWALRSSLRSLFSADLPLISEGPRNLLLRSPPALKLIHIVVSVGPPDILGGGCNTRRPLLTQCGAWEHWVALPGPTLQKSPAPGNESAGQSPPDAKHQYTREGRANAPCAAHIATTIRLSRNTCSRHFSGSPSSRPTQHISFLTVRSLGLQIMWSLQKQYYF